MSDRIEKHIELNATVSRVWQALTDYREFGKWFGVDLEGPFVVGEPARGRVTHPGYEHLVWQATVTKIDPERAFAFTWRPYAIDPATDYSHEPLTTVEFTLEAIDGRTRLTLTESGFDGIPAGRRTEAFRMNEKGWVQQMKNIAAHVESPA